MIKGKIHHGGDLGDVAGCDHEAAGWIDLSTGINPVPYPVGALAGNAWSRLPGRHALHRLLDAAVAYYRAPARDCVVAAAGSQSLIQLLPTLFTPRNVSVVGPTYAEHAPAWQNAGHRVREIADVDMSGDEEITVLVNPNNPDGNQRDPGELIAAASRRADAGGHLVVDEAFADVAETLSLAHAPATCPVIVLKSFGKFFGLAGLRLGFAIAPKDIAARLRERLGPWAVSGPAIGIASRAFADTRWHAEARRRLGGDTDRMRAMLRAAGLEIVGGTDLFTLAADHRAPALFQHLLDHRIYVRRFPDTPEWLRFGLPGNEDNFRRLETAFQTFDR